MRKYSNLSTNYSLADLTQERFYQGILATEDSHLIKLYQTACNMNTYYELSGDRINTDLQFITGTALNITCHVFEAMCYPQALSELECDAIWALFTKSLKDNY